MKISRRNLSKRKLHEKGSSAAIIDEMAIIRQKRPEMGII